MSRKTWPAGAWIASLVLLLGAAPAHAQFQLARWTADNGGGAVAGGGFSLTGTIGQPDAGLHTGGSFTLQGGFWFGGAAVVGVGDDPDAAAPATVELALSVAPNPIRGTGTVQLELPRPGPVRLAVYDVTGRRLATIANREFQAGTHALAVRAEDDQGRRVPTGVYFLRLEAGERSVTRRMLVVR